MHWIIHELSSLRRSASTWEHLPAAPSLAATLAVSLLSSLQIYDLCKPVQVESDKFCEATFGDFLMNQTPSRWLVAKKASSFPSFIFCAALVDALFPVIGAFQKNHYAEISWTHKQTLKPKKGQGNSNETFPLFNKKRHHLCSNPSFVPNCHRKPFVTSFVFHVRKSLQKLI